MSRFCFLILTLLFVVAARARLDDREEETAIYLVLVDGEPLAAAFQQQELDRNATSYQAQKRRVVRLHDRLLRRAMDGGSYRKLYSFHHAVNGFAVHTTPSQGEKLRTAPEVVAVEEDGGTKLMTTYTPRLIGLPDGVWPGRDGDDSGGGNDGEGMVIGVVDTGIDPAHPSFAYLPRSASPPDGDVVSLCGREPFPVCSAGPRFPPGSCNGKIATARYFAAGAAAVLPLDAPRDLSPFDADGHGSTFSSSETHIKEDVLAPSSPGPVVRVCDSTLRRAGVARFVGLPA